MSATPAPSRSRHGATLVEVLVAIGIGTMIVTLIVLAHHTLTSETSRLLKGRKAMEQQETIVSALRDDLHGLFLPVGDSDCGITLENAATNLVMLRFCRWLPAGDRRTVPASNHLEQVTYRYSDDQPPSLLVIRHALNGPGALAGDTTNRIPDAWPRILVSLYDGTEWKTNWVPAKADEANPPRPRAARIVLLTDDRTGDSATETVVVIPSGMTVTSTIVRAGSGEPLR